VFLRALGVLCGLELLALVLGLGGGDLGEVRVGLLLSVTPPDSSAALSWRTWPTSLYLSWCS
jgi:hypothetical protein